jgi:hypothetical protein
MHHAGAAILWTILALLVLRPGILGSIVLSIVLFEVFYLASSQPIAIFETWPLLRPSSTPACIVAGILLAIVMVKFCIGAVNTPDNEAPKDH